MAAYLTTTIKGMLILTACMVIFSSLVACDESSTAVIRVDENVSVTDSTQESSSPVIIVDENIGVSDLPHMYPSVTISVVENIGVNDLPQLNPTVIISVVENIEVNDLPTLTPQIVPTPTPKPLPPPTPASPGKSSSPGPIISLLTPTMQWSSMEKADYYGVYILDISTKSIVFNSQAGNINITGTEYALPSGVLAWGKSYYWYMNSFNSAGWGNYSAPLYFQTQTPDKK